MTGDRAIRRLTSAVVLAVAAFAAVVSYSHIYDLGRAHVLAEALNSAAHVGQLALGCRDAVHLAGLVPVPAHAARSGTTCQRVMTTTWPKTSPRSALVIRPAR